MAFWNKSKEAKSDPFRGDKQGFASKLLTLRVVTIRSDGTTHSTHGQSVRERLLELAQTYEGFLDERLYRLGDGDAQPVGWTGWSGGLQSYAAIHMRSKQLLDLVDDQRKGDKPRPADVSDADLAIEAEILHRIVRYSRRLVEVFIRLAREGGDEEHFRNATTVPKVPTLTMSGETRGKGAPSATQFLAAWRGSKSLADDDSVEIWQEHWRTNFVWNNEVATSERTGISWVPQELLPEAHRSTTELPPLNLDSDTRQLVDAALELGTDHVAMQSTMTLSGDITTRISAHIPPDEAPLYLAIHRAGMEASLSHWQNLIQAVSSFIENLIELVVSKPKGG